VISLRDVLTLVAAFAAGTLVAGALGAANLGTALTFGTIAFLVAVLALMLLPKDR
jgi:long-subunit fatty acid transport protein